MSDKSHKVYVYGTLRKGGDTRRITGYKMYDISWFPGVVKDESSEITVECIEVDDEGLAGFDRYEGYSPSRPESSLYLREPLEDGWIYVYNKGAIDRPEIESGDWYEYRKEFA